MCCKGRLNVFVTKIAVCINVVAYVSLLSVEKNNTQCNYSGHMQGNVLAALIRRMQNDNMREPLTAESLHRLASLELANEVQGLISVRLVSSISNTLGQAS